MITILVFLFSLIQIPICQAEIVFESPSIGEIVNPGKYSIHAGDNGTTPTVGQFAGASWEVDLFTGNDTAPFQLYEYDLKGYKMTDPSVQSPPVNIRNDSGPSLENKYFFGYRSYLTANESIWVTTYSDRFTLTNMTGSLPDDVVAANNQVDSTTAPRRTISCGQKQGGYCDQSVLEKLGLGALTDDSTAVSTSVTATFIVTTTASPSVPVNTESALGDNNSNTTTNKKISGGAIAGIVIGVLVALTMILAAVFFFIQARKRGRSKIERARNVDGLEVRRKGAFWEKATYGGVSENVIQSKEKPVELEGNRSHEMSAERHHSAVEMPGNL